MIKYKMQPSKTVHSLAIAVLLCLGASAQAPAPIPVGNVVMVPAKFMADTGAAIIGMQKEIDALHKENADLSARVANLEHTALFKGL